MTQHEDQTLESIFDEIKSNEKVIRKPSALKEEQKEEKERKEKKEQQKLRKLFVEREHVTQFDPNDPHERELRKIALKGVVQLFNAISEHQHKLKVAQMKDDDVTKDIDDYIDETVSKEDFLGKLVKSQQIERNEIKKQARKTSKKIKEGSKGKKQKHIEEEKKEKEQKKIEKSKLKKEKREERKKEKQKEEKRDREMKPKKEGKAKGKK